MLEISAGDERDCVYWRSMLAITKEGSDSVKHRHKATELVLHHWRTRRMESPLFP